MFLEARCCAVASFVCRALPHGCRRASHVGRRARYFQIRAKEFLWLFIFSLPLDYDKAGGSCCGPGWCNVERGE